ncbi:MAG: bifunctional phosphoribosyl-AMP cyclohydrolase/phosphoribosyl-ATP diphosphatase HisIE [Nitrospinota bacterium]
MEISTLKFDEKGLIPAIVQDAKSGDVLMLAYMNKESIAKTIETGYTHFFSRSRNRLWKKGETSGHLQKVQKMYADCDKDTVLIKVMQTGVACHTGSWSCFSEEVWSGGEAPDPSAGAGIIDSVHKVILSRKESGQDDSYVASLFKKGEDSILKKIGEEAGEVIIASKNADRDEIVWEVADLWFHSLVLLGFHTITPEDIYAELKKRFGKKGKKSAR